MGLKSYRELTKAQLCEKFGELDRAVNRDLVRTTHLGTQFLQWNNVIKELEDYLRDARYAAGNSKQSGLKNLIRELRKEASHRRLISRRIKRKNPLVGVEGDHAEAYENAAEAIENRQFNFFKDSLKRIRELPLTKSEQLLQCLRKQIARRAKERKYVRWEFKRRNLDPYKDCP